MAKQTREQSQKQRDKKNNSDWIAQKKELYKDHMDEATNIINALYKKGTFFYTMFMTKLNAWKYYAMLSFDRWNDMTQEDKKWMTNVVTPFTYIHCKSLYEKIFGFKHEADVIIKPPLIENVYMPDEEVPQEEKGLTQEESIENWLNKVIEVTGLIESYSEITKNFIVHGSSWARLDIHLHKDYFDVQTKNKENEILKEELTLHNAKNLDMSVSVFEPYNFIYDQRKTNVYKSTFFQYINYEPIDDVLKRWSIFLTPSEIQEIKDNVGQGGIYDGIPDYKRYRELEAVDEYLCNIDPDISQPINVLGIMFKDGRANFDTMAFLSALAYERDYLIQEHYTPEYITLMIQGIPIKVVDNFYSKHTKEKIYHPYVQFNITESPYKTLNKSIPEVLVSLQKMNDMIFNGFSDQMKMSLRPMYQSDGTVQFTKDGERVDRIMYEPYGIIENYGSGKLDIMRLGEINGSIINVMDWIQAMGQIITSITRYTGGGTKGVERSATGADRMAEITLDAVRPTHFGMASATNRILKIGMILTKEYFGDKIVSGDKTIDLTGISQINDIDFDVTFKSDSVGDLVESKLINKVIRILEGMRPEIIQMASLSDGPFLNVRKLFKDLFDKIDMNGVVFSDSEIETYMENIRDIIRANEIQEQQNQQQNSIESINETNIPTDEEIDFNNL